MINVINKSCFPKALKKARVTPLYKGGKKDSANDYRPISVLPVTSKVFEKVLNTRLVQYMNSLNFLYPYQYGFREAGDTTSATIDLVSDLQVRVDRGNRAALVSLDLRKAFDTVNHGILLRKMELLGIRGVCHGLFKSYLEGRNQCVSLNNIKSSCLDLTCGVPQGSILGPTLFLLYINSVANLELRGKIRLYADDTIIAYFGDSVDDLNVDMKSDLVKIERWLINHKLSLNIEKSGYMFVSSQRVLDQPSLDFGNNQLKYCHNIKYLGLLIDETLTWDEHINKLKNKLYAPVGILKRLSYSIPSHLLRSVYFSLIHSHLQYLAVLWYLTSKYLINPIKTLQNRAIKNIYGLPLRYPTELLYRKYNIMSLEQIYKYQICTFVHHNLHGTRHTNISMRLRNTVHNHGTRHQNDIDLLRASTKYGKNSVFYRGASVYNSVPLNLRCLNFSQFRLKIKKHFLA